MDWIKEMEFEEFEDILTGDVKLIYDVCGPEVLFTLWQNLPGISLYLSEKSLFQIKRRYIIKFYNKNDPVYNAKALATKLGVSEKFVYETIASKKS